MIIRLTSRNGSEPFLTSGIPYLKLDAFAIQLDGANLKVDTNGSDEGWCEGII